MQGIRTVIRIMWVTFLKCLFSMSNHYFICWTNTNVHNTEKLKTQKDIKRKNNTKQHKIQTEKYEMMICTLLMANKFDLIWFEIYFTLLILSTFVHFRFQIYPWKCPWRFHFTFVGDVSLKVSFIRADIRRRCELRLAVTDDAGRRKARSNLSPGTYGVRTGLTYVTRAIIRERWQLSVTAEGDSNTRTGVEMWGGRGVAADGVWINHAVSPTHSQTVLPLQRQ